MLFDCAGHVTTSLVGGGVAHQDCNIQKTPSRAAVHLLPQG
jgi:hypothetical protein